MLTGKVQIISSSGVNIKTFEIDYRVQESGSSTQYSMISQIILKMTPFLNAQPTINDAIPVASDIILLPSEKAEIFKNFYTFYH